MTASRARTARPDEDTAESDLGQTSYSRAAAAIRRDIVRGVIADGERLLTTELARRYGLSLAPIREALHQLAAEGVVVFEPKRGALARGMTPDFLREIYEIRLGLVPYLEGVRAAVAEPAHLAELAAIEARYEAAVQTRAFEAAVRINGAFHRAILDIDENREALQILRRHHLIIQELRLRHGFAPGRPETVIAEHHRILDALRRRDTEEAQAVSRAHIRHAYEEMVQLCFPGR